MLGRNSGTSEGVPSCISRWEVPFRMLLTGHSNRLQRDARPPILPGESVHILLEPGEFATSIASDRLVSRRPLQFDEHFAAPFITSRQSQCERQSQ